MRWLLRGCMVCLTGWMVCANGAFATPTGDWARLAYEPVALDWSAAEVERASAGNLRSIIQRADRDGQLGCTLSCERVQRVFGRLVDVARLQTERARELAWTLHVVQSPEVDASVLPDGQMVISEAFIAANAADDASLAFVLAHEMAHSILEHERQTLHFAGVLLPAGVQRSVADMYTEIDYNFALFKALGVALRQYEFEADELGLMMASAAGFAPRQQLGFLIGEAGRHADAGPIVQTHPPSAQRLDRLRLRLPLADRLHQMALGRSR